jgi:hypothetical protein
MNSLILAAALLGMTDLYTKDVEVAFWMENGDHIFIIDGVAHDVGGDCYDITDNGNGTHIYTWTDRSGTVVVSITQLILSETDGEFFLVEEGL